MGRQAHVTLLALGRSPFGEPLRDENGDFILGAHAYDNDAPGYRQQFDDRGHPQNRSAKAAAARLRKAQNDVLATVGVVVKNGEERKSKWEKLEDDEKLDIILDENRRGCYVKGEDRVLGMLLPWSIVSLRRRLMTFAPYFIVPVTDLAIREYHALGSLGLLFPGLPLQLLSCLPRTFRLYLPDPDVEDIVNYTQPWQNENWCGTLPMTIRWHSILNVSYLIELPLIAHATLQSLHIIPANTGLHWRSFVPFSALSPISLPVIPNNITKHSIIVFATTLLQTPLLLYLAREYLQVQLGYRLYALLRQILPKPDKPDAISAEASDNIDTVGSSPVSGAGYPWPKEDFFFKKGQRYFGAKSFFGALKLAFPPVYRLLNTISRGRLARSCGRLTPLLDRQLKTAVRSRYWHDRMYTEPIPKRGTLADRDFRHRIVHTVFDYANLDPVEELVDMIAWTSDTLGPKADILRGQGHFNPSISDRSEAPRLRVEAQHAEAENNPHLVERVSNILNEAVQALPGSDAVFIQASDGPVVMFSQETRIDPQSVADMENIHTIDANQVPIVALLQGVENRHFNADPAQQVDIEAQGPSQQASQHPLQHPPQRPVQFSPQLPPQFAPETPPLQQEEPLIMPHRSPASPRTGISLVQSNTNSDVQPLTPPTLRPLRRPTETDDSLAAISESLRAEAETLQSRRLLERTQSTERERQSELPLQTIRAAPPPPDPPLLPQKHRLYRVTMLSNHVADSLAWHTSALLTSLILWPLEAIWLRSLADWALQNPAMGQLVDPWWAARLGFGVVGRPVSVLGLGTWFGGASDGGGRVRYMGSILLTLGLEGIVRGMCWGLGLWCVKGWRGRYGWGQL